MFYCLYCLKGVAKLPLHLTRVHGKEEQVKKLSELKGVEKQLMLTKLRNLGTNCHNNLLNEKNMEPKGFQVKYRPKSQKNTSKDYVNYAGCYGVYTRKTLWKHQKRCLLCNEFNKGITKAREETELPIKTNTPTKKVLDKLRQDSISDIIVNDGLLIKYAEALAMKGESEASYSRNTLRELARLLEQIQINTQNNELTFVDLLKPQM